MNDQNRFHAAADMLTEHIRMRLLKIPEGIKAKATEIRLRVGRPISIVCISDSYFLGVNGEALKNAGHGAYILTKPDMHACFVSICGWAVHSHQNEMANGYISVKGGHRAGIAATAVLDDNGKVTAVRDITSINLRIAREIIGSAKQLVKEHLSDKLRGLLIIGPPSSGKTTLLRDMARQLSVGENERYLKVCVVDESGEIGASFGGELQNDIGVCSDLLTGYPKAKGLEIAVRYLSPQVIICDEICSQPEVAAVELAANSGVAVITSMHAADFSEFMRKPQAGRLLEIGVFERVVLLCGADKPSMIKEVKRVGDLCSSC